MENQTIRQAGLKVTVPRVKIFEILQRAEPHHVSAEDVYQALLAAGEEVGLATVYRVLTQFETAGLVQRHNFEENHSVFEIAHGEHHDHLVCVECGQVDEFVDEVIEQHQETIAKRANFTMTDHSLTIYGVCAKCQGA